MSAVEQALCSVGLWLLHDGLPRAGLLLLCAALATLLAGLLGILAFRPDPPKKQPTPGLGIAPLVAFTTAAELQPEDETAAIENEEPPRPLA